MQPRHSPEKPNDAEQYAELDPEDERVQNLPLAFVFMNSEIGSEQEVLEQVSKIDGVKEAYTVYGVYDIVVKVEALTSDTLRELVTSKVRKLGKVRSTLTMMVIE